MLGVVDDGLQLLGEEPDVQRVEYRPKRRHGEVELQVAKMVPGIAQGASPPGAKAVVETGSPMGTVNSLYGETLAAWSYRVSWVVYTWMQVAMVALAKSRLAKSRPAGEKVLHSAAW